MQESDFMTFSLFRFTKVPISIFMSNNLDLYILVSIIHVFIKHLKLIFVDYNPTPARIFLLSCLKFFGLVTREMSKMILDTYAIP